MAANQMISKLNYHEHSTTFDARTQNNLIVTHYVKQQKKQKKLEAKPSHTLILDNRDEEKIQAVTQVANHAGSNISSISCTVLTAVDSPRGQLKSTAFVANDNFIRQKPIKPSVTEDFVISGESRYLKKCEKTKADIAASIRPKSNSCKETAIGQVYARENLNRSFIAVYEERKKNNNLTKANITCSQESRKERTSFEKLAVDLQKTEAKASSCENKSSYVKGRVPNSSYSKSRSAYFKQHSVASKNNSHFHYRSAFDLTFRTCSKRETLITDDESLICDFVRNDRSFFTRNIDLESFTDLDKSKKKVSQEKKRLCKSLSNLTAEDFLSVPCVSIHSGKSNSILRLTPKTICVQDSKAKEKTSNTKVQVKPESEMSKHMRTSRPRSNGKLQVSNVKVSKNEASDKLNEIESSVSIYSEEKNFETKETKKTPKLTKSLFSSFLRKNRKRQTSIPAEQTIPKSVLPAPDSSHSHSSCSNLQSLNKTTEEPVSGVVSSLTEANSYKNVDVGFKRLTISPSRTQQNIHLAYANRLARVRNEGSKTPSPNSTNTSPNSALSRDKSGDQTSFKNTLEKDVKVIFRNKLNSKFLGQRLSVDYSSSPESATKKFIRRRPSSLAVPGKDPLKRYGDGSKNSFNLSCFSSNDHLEEEPFRSSDQKYLSGSVAGQRKASQPKLIGFTKVRSSPKMSTVDSSHDFLSQRCSFDLAVVETKSSPVTPNDVAKENFRTMSSLKTPISSDAASTSQIFAAGGSLASSFGSVFEDVNIDKKKMSDKEQIESSINRHSNQKSSLQKERKIVRSKSLCRHVLASENSYADNKSRSVSPSFGELSFKPSSSKSYTVNKRSPRNPVTRNQSMKEISSFVRPAKPTTPKPRKVSSASSVTSLNQVNFQTPPLSRNPSQVDVQIDRNSIRSAKEVLLRNVDGRNRTSVKNAQIRRRMSLQLSRSRNVDLTEDKRQVHEFEDLKRNSMGGFDAEKMKLGTAKWSSASPSGNNHNINLRSRRRTRPLSEIQNLRWEVRAIPEHNELSDVQPKCDFPKDSNHLPISSSSNIETQLSSVASVYKKNITVIDDNASNAAYERVLGTCFSEEDVSSIYRNEEFFTKPILPRSFSLKADMHHIANELLSFNRKKLCWENLRTTLPRHFFSHSYFLNNSCYHDKVKGYRSTISDVEDISNESGYGSISRKSNHLRPNNIEDEEVFHNNSSRLSNSDFPTENGLYVEALWDHVTMDDEELGFKVGDVIRVIDMSNSDWWWGELESKQGWFPATFVRILVNQHREYEDYVNEDVDEEDDACECSRVTTFDEEDPTCPCGKRRSTASIHCSNCGRPWNGVPLHPRDSNHPNHPEIVVSSAPTVPRKTSVTREHIRKNVINEIVNSEKVFVGHLKDVVQGYLARCRQRPDMFTDEQIMTVFSNIEEIYEFQRQFAIDLEEAFNHSSVHSTELGKVFLNHKSGFKIYSEYCNNHPQALSLLSQLFTVKKYMQFFEACRLLQRMIDISLDGFLLTPVQKICKYPLQLAELLKYTSPDYPDYEPVKNALVAMKNVARMINERKRMLENIRKISIWQSSVLNWKGDNVLERSRELVHSGEVYSSKQSKEKSKLRTVFLFDHQLIICKKDLLRKDLLYYKSRLDLDRYTMIPMDGCSPRSSANLSGDWSSTASSSSSGFGWKLTERGTGESILMQCKNEEDFDKWMKYFPQEREIALSKSEYEINFREELAKGLLKTTFVTPRKPKDSTSAPSYHYRMKMAQDSSFLKRKPNNSAIEKSTSSFFSSVAEKLTPFRRATTKEPHPVY